VLDEATSSLDMASEATVGGFLNTHGATTIVIAHRLSTVRNADLILVFDRGEVVEEGTHEELLLQDGFYAELVRDQMTTAPDRNGTGAHA
jgi:ABC-type multidrug transport system fused ATPase/permease subunit